MNRKPLTLTLRGVRGSTPTPGAHTVRYGGHTTCLELALAPRHRLVIDCGSGLGTLQSDLPSPSAEEGLRFDIFLTHYHWDHLEGLRFFQPLYDAGSEFTFYGTSWQEMTLQQVLEGSMSPPWFPIRWQDTASKKRYVELAGRAVTIGDVTVTPADVVHPQGAIAYRLQRGERAIAFVTDSEPGDREAGRALAELARGVDVLIHDAQYLPQEYEDSYRDWGHSSWRHAVEAARATGAGWLVLFHHDPGRSDDELDRVVEAVRREFPAVDAAREGMTFDL